MSKFLFVPLWLHSGHNLSSLIFQISSFLEQCFHIICFYIYLLLRTQSLKVWKYLWLHLHYITVMHSSEGIKYKFVNLNIVLTGAKWSCFPWRMPLLNHHRIWRECLPIFKPQDLEFNASKRRSTCLKNQVWVPWDCFLWIQIIFEKVHFQKYTFQGKEKSS